MRQERELDQLVVADVCALRLPGVTAEKVAMAVQRRNKRADIRVAYELLLDSKKARHRKEGGLRRAPACFSEVCQDGGGVGSGVLFSCCCSG